MDQKKISGILEKLVSTNKLVEEIESRIKNNMRYLRHIHNNYLVPKIETLEQKGFISMLKNFQNFAEACRHNHHNGEQILLGLKQIEQNTIDIYQTVHVDHPTPQSPSRSQVLPTPSSPLINTPPGVYQNDKGEYRHILDDRPYSPIQSPPRKRRSTGNSNHSSNTTGKNSIKTKLIF
jgi:hypothetical protein